MNKALKNVLSSIAACSLMLAGGVTNAKNGQEHTLRLALQATPGNPLYEGAQKFSDLVAQKSEGKIKIKLFGAGTLGKDIAIASSMQGGVIDFALMNTSLLSGIARETALLDLPFLFENEKEAYPVLDGPIGAKIHAALEPKGLVGLAYFELGFYNLHSGKRPIAKLEDLQGLKMRTVETPIAIDLMNTLGANAVPIPHPELYQAYEQKIVDGGGWPTVNLWFYKVYEVQKYLSITRQIYAPQSMLVSKKSWDKLSGDEKRIIQEAANEARDYQRKQEWPRLVGQNFGFYK